MAGKAKGNDRLAQLLAAATAGATMEPSPGGGVKGPNRPMDTLAALGMSRANTWGAMILLASYQEDPRATRYVIRRAIRFAWQAWLKNADPGHTVTTRQIEKLATMAVADHMHPAKARQMTVVKRAKILGVNHQTFQRKFKTHYHRIMAELQYEEGEAARLLTRRL